MPGERYTDYPNKHMLLFGVTQCNNVLFKSSRFTNEILIDCLSIIGHNLLFLGKILHSH